jgi:hypothetical protein
LLVVLGCLGFPHLVDPMMPFNRMPFCTKHQILVWLGVKKVRVFY